MTRLQEVAWEFCRADEALRVALIRAERAEATVRRMQRIMGAAMPPRITVVNEHGHREIHSLPRS